MPDSDGNFRGISVSRVWPGHPDYEEAWRDLGKPEQDRLDPPSPKQDRPEPPDHPQSV